jgi:hypothetical protein
MMICLYFGISSVWSLIKIVIFIFVWTAKLESKFLAGCIQRDFCILCNVDKRHVHLIWKCMRVRDVTVSRETDQCGARVSLPDHLVLNVNIVESQLSNLWLSEFPFYPTCRVIRTLYILHLSAFILQQPFYQQLTWNVTEWITLPIAFMCLHFNCQCLCVHSVYHLHVMYVLVSHCSLLMDGLVKQLFFINLSHVKRKWLFSWNNNWGLTNANRLCTNAYKNMALVMGRWSKWNWKTLFCQSFRWWSKRRKKDDGNVNMKRWAKLYICGSHKKQGKTPITGPLLQDKALIFHKSLMENPIPQLVQDG